MGRERQTSNGLYNLFSKIIHGIKEDRSKALFQKDHICYIIREIFENTEIYLCSIYDDTAFSKHGSLHEQTSVNKVHDIDIYVCFNGTGLVYREYFLGENAIINKKKSIFLPTDIELYSNGGEQYSNIGRINTPFRCKDAINIMMHHISRKLKQYGNFTYLEETNRGVKVRFNGRYYDIIPAFLFREDGQINHIIPSRNGNWEINPTQQCLDDINSLNDRFPRNIENKVLSFRDIIRFIKAISDRMKWESKYGITSFIIKDCCIRHFFSITPRYNSLNQTLLYGVGCIIQEIVHQGGFKDPISGNWIKLSGSYKHKQFNFGLELRRFLSFKFKSPTFF